MPDLIAQGLNPQDRWRRTLPGVDSENIIVGRTAQGWAVPWDDRVSRQHAELLWDGSRLSVSRRLEARNPIFYRGVRKDEFKISVGEHFVIGQTTFSLVDQRIRVIAPADEQPAMTEHTFASSQLRQVRYRDADHRIDVLSRLPEIIQGSSSDEELFVRMVNLLLQGIQRATFVAVVAEPTSRLNSDQSNANEGDLESGFSNVAGLSESLGQQGPIDQGIRVLHWDARNLAGQQFSPSAGLIRSALVGGESVLHVWSRSVHANSSFTQTENIDWAFCTPVHSEACPGWAIYVAGDFGAMLDSDARDATLDVSNSLQDELEVYRISRNDIGVAASNTMVAAKAGFTATIFCSRRSSRTFEP